MHKPVMEDEVVGLLAVREGGTYIDGTLGTGGHARAILERLGPAGRVLGIDRDAEVLPLARQRLAPWRSQCSCACGNFADLVEVAGRLGIDAVDGVLLDLGISSVQLDEAERGFSFTQDGPLDMRMDRTQEVTAGELVRSLTVEELADLFRTLGEEPFARRIARAVVSDRGCQAVLTTRWLADLVLRVKGGRRGRHHAATRTFQALRMAVNREIECLEKGLEEGIRLLKRGGRMAVFSYHSLEDRSVKQVFGRHVGRLESQQAGGRSWTGTRPVVAWVKKRPLTASKQEVADNPRARSAKLRVIERKE